MYKLFRVSSEGVLVVEELDLAGAGILGVLDQLLRDKQNNVPFRLDNPGTR